MDTGNGGRLAWRDADLITGAEVETLSVRYLLPETGSGTQGVFPVSGSSGGVGSNLGSPRGGDGGPGGAAGDIVVQSALLQPTPMGFSSLYAIQGFVPGQRLQPEDFGSRGDGPVGQVIQAISDSGMPLYRVRVNTRDATVGGLGGIPSGKSTGYPGNVGALGAEGLFLGLPLR